MEKFFEPLSDKILTQLSKPFFRWLSLFIILVGLFLRELGADPDLFARVAVGRWVAKFGAVSLTDPFAFTLTKPMWIDHEWLAGVVFYYISLLGQDLALFVSKIIFSFISIFLVTKASKLNTGRGLNFALLLLFVLDIIVVWTSTIRAQVFTYLFVPIFLCLIVHHRQTSGFKLFLSMPILTALWCNLHGGFVVGLGFLGLYALTLFIERDKRALFVLAVAIFSLLGTLINPYGFHYWIYMYEALLHARTTISEWAPVNIMDSALIVYFLVLFISLIGLFSLRGRIPLEGKLMLLCAAYYSSSHVRFTPIFMMVSVVYIFPFIQDLFPGIYEIYNYRKAVLHRAAVIALVLALGIVGVQSYQIYQRGSFRLDYSFYPVAATAWMNDNLDPGRVLVDFNRGSFALWRLFPKFLISVDGRYEELYPESTVIKSSQAIDPSNPNCPGALKELVPDYILIDQYVRSGAEYRPCIDGWRRIYSDGQFAVFSSPDLEIDENLEPIKYATTDDMWVSRF